MDLHRELPWTQCMSNDEFQLFLMCQEWAGAKELEAHMSSKHAMQFNDAVVSGKLLVTEPSVSIFGAPLTAAEPEARAAQMQTSGYQPPTPSRIAGGSTGVGT